MKWRTGLLPSTTFPMQNFLSPRSEVTRWINGIAAGIYQSIIKETEHKYSRILLFLEI